MGSASELIFCIIDAGATSTNVALFLYGEEHSRTQWGSVKPNHVSLREDVLIEQLLAWLPPLPQPPAIVLGIAGVFTEHEKGVYRSAFLQTWAQTTTQQLPALTVISDAELAHAAAFGAEAGILCILGTGSIALAKNRMGEWSRVGGFGNAIDDLGGGHWLGVQALQAVVQMLDTRAPNTLLVRAVGAFLRADYSNTELMLKLLRGVKTDSAARLAPAVFSYAEEGDAVAKSILVAGAEHIANIIKAATKLVPDVPIVLHGSLAHKEVYVQLIVSKLPEAEVPTVLPDVLFGAYQQICATE